MPYRPQQRRPVGGRTIVGIAVLGAAILVLLVFQVGFLEEYRLYLTEDRKPASLELSALSEEWDEARVKERFAGFPVFCNPYEGDLPVQRVCTVDVASVNGVPALFVAFMFAGGHLDQAIIDVPCWSWSTARRWLAGKFGAPSAAEVLPRDGQRLLGWRLDDGAAVFFNRDLPYMPPFWNSIYWRSATACRSHACFKERTPRLDR